MLPLPFGPDEPPRRCRQQGIAEKNWQPTWQTRAETARFAGLLVMKTRLLCPRRRCGWQEFRSPYGSHPRHPLHHPQLHVDCACAVCLGFGSA